MTPCASIRPLLTRYADGELSPDEAIRVGRHLPGCTACRIHLAREGRLAELLSGGLDDLPVADDFAESVMATLPQGPPPRRSRRPRRGLKLASLFGLIALAGFLGLQMPGAPETVLRMPSWPTFDPDSSMFGPARLAGAGQIALSAIQSLGAGSPVSLGSLGAMMSVLLLAALSLLGLFGGMTGFVAVAAHRLLRPARSVRP